MKAGERKEERKSRGEKKRKRKGEGREGGEGKKTTGKEKGRKSKT